MKILLDHNVPLYLAKLFQGHEVATTFRQGWAGLKNGELLKATEDAGFELFVTMDQNLQYQQRLKDRLLCIAILDPQGQAEEHVLSVGLNLVRRLAEVQPGVLITVRRVDL